MDSLDETDLEILSMLGEDARRPYSDIADSVGLSGPAVSDRVTRLRDAGIVRRFTVDIDRSQLHAGLPVFVRTTVPRGEVEAVRERVGEADAVEHVFVTADGGVWFVGRAQVERVHEWLDGLLRGFDGVEYEVTLLDAVEWRPSLSGAAFALTCDECGNTVDAEGESTRIGGEVHHFCCPSCRTRFEERYDRLEEGA